MWLTYLNFENVEKIPKKFSYFFQFSKKISQVCKTLVESSHKDRPTGHQSLFGLFRSLEVEVQDKPGNIFLGLIGLFSGLEDASHPPK